MNLQQITIRKIDDYGGRYKLTGTLKKYAMALNGKQKREMNTMILYIDMLYFFEMDIVRDIINKRDNVRKRIALLEHLIDKYNSETLLFIKELIEFNMYQADAIKKLAG